MYNRYRKCCCQNNYNPKVIETACKDAGTTAQYMQDINLDCCCKCNDNGFLSCNCNSSSQGNCECGFDEEPSAFPENPMLAQSYVPVQTMNKTFTPCCGLRMGTIFPELVSPYFPCQSMQEINYLKEANEIGKGCNKC